MKQFTYTKTSEIDSAVQEGSANKTAQQGAEIRFIAGGTTMLDLMKLMVETPNKLIDINRLPLDKIDTTSDGGIKIGAMVRNSDLAHHPYVKTHYQVLSEALLSGASAQLRNMATTGGNLLQRTRCVYFRDTEFACNKREPGSGCAAMDGDNRMMAVLGTSDKCIASNPSDMNVALMALEATINIKGKDGEREVPISEFYTLPGNTPDVENVLKPGDLITHVSIKPIPPGSNSTYLKLRDRASYEFALASAAVITQMKDGKIAHARVALGAVGTIPWRSPEAESVLLGAAPTPENFRKAADAALKNAKPQTHNKFKIELSKRCLTHALKLVTTA